MAQPSTLNPLSGPLAGKHLEFHGTDVMIGSASDCAVRIDAPGVEAHHARIVIDAIGATIYRGDGPVGVNDDLVAADARLRSGDFVWIGEPAGENSIMLQFTLGDGEPAPMPAPVLVEEAYFEAAPEGELMEEMTSEELVASAPEGIDEVLVEEGPPAFEQSAESSEVLEPALEFDPSHEETEPFEAPLEQAEMMEAHEPQPLGELEASFDEPAPFVPPSEAPATPSSSSPKVPPAPWQTASAAEPEPAPADYASAWESPAKPPAPEAVAAPAPPAPSPAPPPAPRPPSQTAAAKRAAPATPAKGKADALRTPVPPPPARTTSSTPMIVGGLVALLLLAGGGAYFLTSGTPAPVPQKPTPAPTAVVVATPPPVAPELTVAAPPSETVAPTSAAAPIATPAPPAAGAPTAPATPTPRTTPTPGRPAAGTPAVATPVPAAAAPAAPVATPVPRLLEEARAALAAKDLSKAAQLFDQALKAEPTNSAALAGKAEVAARLGALGRKFTMGATNTIGGKAAKGPTGFDLGGGAAVKADHSGQVRCTTTPAAVEPGTKFTLKCSLLNSGAKGFKIEEVTGSETVDNAARGSGPGEGSTPKQELAPRAEVVIFEKSGSWSAANSWRLEILVKTNKDESFRSAYTWR